MKKGVGFWWWEEGESGRAVACDGCTVHIVQCGLFFWYVAGLACWFAGLAANYFIFFLPYFSITELHPRDHVGPTFL